MHVWTAVVDWRLGFVTLPEGLLYARDVRFRVSAGGQSGSLVWAGQVWRLWTSVLLHADLLHLGVNLVALYGLGRLLEPWVGTLRWLAWFTVGGLFASGVSLLAQVPQSDGASGGAFTLLGAAVVLGWELRKRLPHDDRKLMGPWLWGFLALNLVLSVAIPSIDVVGHLGGLLTGLLLGGLVGLRRKRWLTVMEAGWVVLFGLACVVGFALATG